MIRRTGFNLLLSLLLCASIAHAMPEPEQELRVGVLSFRGSDKARERWQSTLDHLTDTIPGYRFIPIPLDLNELDQAVIDGTIDFAITNSGQYVRVGSKYGMSWLATLKSRRHQGLGPVIGSALVVRADSPYHTLDDLRGEVIGAVDPLAFGGFQIYWGEMAHRGFQPERFFELIKFSDFPVDALAFWVRDRQVTAAILPACLLESMSEEGLINSNDYRVIDARDIDGYRCQSSTLLYPNWSFSKLKATPDPIAEAVAESLLQLPADSAAARDAGSLGWTAPVSSYDIHQLYQQLDIHPWQFPWWQEAFRWLLRNWVWGIGALLVVLLGFLHHLWIQLLVKRRTRELLLMDQELHHQQQQLEHAQRVAILGELSSDLAHELNQPLAAINSYAEGGAVRIERGAERQELVGLFERISGQAQRGAKIIDRIRCFAQKDRLKREQVDLKLLLRETLQLLDYDLKRAGTEPRLNLNGCRRMVEVDPIEIQQLLVNLIRNSLEAMHESPLHPQLHIMIAIEDSDCVTLQIEDSGHGVDESEVEGLFKPFYSTKPKGLGLGMSICRRIVEAHEGTIEMGNSTLGGARVVCRFKGSGNE